MPPEIKERLVIHQNGLVLYSAGSDYPGIFPRDSFISGDLAKDTVILGDALKFAGLRQGRKINPVTGERPGIIFHEYVFDLDGGIELKPGRTTEFDACDNPALFIHEHAVYERLRRRHQRRLLDTDRTNIVAAADFIRGQINNGLFQDDPRFAGAPEFALPVTYLKDSEIPGRDGGIPAYPVSYLLVQAMVIRGFRDGADILGSSILRADAKSLVEGLQRFYDRGRGVFLMAIDRDGFISGVSSDMLTMLHYLDPEDIDPAQIEGIVEAAVVLETPAGYRMLDPQTAQTVNDPNHSRTIWPVEQALIHKGARKHKTWALRVGNRYLAEVLDHVMEISLRIVPFIKGIYPEKLRIEGLEIRPDGSKIQLWTWAAKEYLSRQLLLQP